MFELSFRFDRAVNIGLFMDYNANEIVFAIDQLKISLYEMRYAKDRLNNEHFLKFRCILLHQRKGQKDRPNYIPPKPRSKTLPNKEKDRYMNIHQEQVDNEHQNSFRLN